MIASIVIQEDNFGTSILQLEHYEDTIRELNLKMTSIQGDRDQKAHEVNLFPRDFNCFLGQSKVKQIRYLQWQKIYYHKFLGLGFIYNVTDFIIHIRHSFISVLDFQHLEELIFKRN